MKFQYQRSVLNDAIAISGRAVSTKNAVSALEGILIEADKEKGLTFYSYNLEIGIITSCPAEIFEEGKIIVNARLFSDISRKLPDELVTFETKDIRGAFIKSGSSEFNIPVSDPSEFPEMPEAETDNLICLKQGLLKDMIQKTIFATAQNDSKPILTGIYFDIDPENKSLTTVACDNFRLSIRKEIFEETETDFSRISSFVLPGTTARELEKILDESDEPVNLYVSMKKICFKINETTVISRLLEGNYYDYKKFIPKKGDIVITTDKKELLDAAERVSLIINEKLRNHIRINIEDTSLTLSCNSSIGTATETISLEDEVKSLEIGFTSRILIDAIRYADAEKLTLELATPILPCVIKPSDKDNYLQIIMPIKLKKS